MGICPQQFISPQRFDSADAAKSGLKVEGVNFGGNRLTGVYEYGAKETADGWAGTVKVTSAAGQYGPASLHIVNTNNESAGIDMTIYVEAAETQKDVTVSNVEVKDLSGDNVIAEDEQNLTVSAASGSTFSLCLSFGCLMYP